MYDFERLKDPLVASNYQLQIKQGLENEGQSLSVLSLYDSIENTLTNATVSCIGVKKSVDKEWI